MAIALAFAVLALGGIVVMVAGWMGLQGKLPGSRAHRRAAPMLIFGGVAVLSAGLAFLPFALAGSVPGAFGAAVALALAGLLLATVVAAWLVGTHQAAAEPG